jgi:hypothetical protein
MYVFIGGPADGKVFAVEEGRSVQFAEEVAPPPLERDNYASRHVHRSVVYEPVRFLAGDRDFVIYAPRDMEPDEVMQRLITSYAKKGTK